MLALTTALLITATSSVADPLQHDADLLQVLKGHTDRVTCLAITADGTIASGAADKTIRIWDTRAGKERLVLQPGATPWSLAFAPGGKLLASGDATKTVSLWDTANGGKTSTFPPLGGAVGRVVFSADGRVMAATSDKGGKVWETATGKEKLSFGGRFALAPDGKTLAAVEPAGKIQLYDLATGKVSLVLAGHEGHTLCLDFSPDGKTLASGGADPKGIRATGNEPNQDKLIRIWDVATGKELRRMEGHRKGLYSLTFGADNRLLVATDFSGDMKHWDTTSGQLVAQLGAVNAGGVRRGTPIGQWLISPDLKTWIAGTTTEVQVLTLTDFSKR